ncbi:MAG TPA: TetR/AcrR family transcriptional regulator [Lentzea sp.]
MARAALSPATVVDVAIRLVDEDGPAALTLAAVASQAGVATPSLYKHVRNLAELRTLLSARIIAEMTERISDAVLGRSADDAIRALMATWRAYAVAHPNRYSALSYASPPSTTEAGQQLLGITLAALRAYGLQDSDAVHAARCVRAAMHGFAQLETGSGFQLSEDLDDTYELLTQMMISGLRHPARNSPPAQPH